MGVFDFESSTLSLWTKMHLSSVRETASLTLGAVSVFVWVVAEIPQIITNYRTKSAEGLSVIFLITWIIGDLFNLFGCLLEPATIPTQLYTAVVRPLTEDCQVMLYTVITVALGSQHIYYGYVYPQLKYKRQLEAETLTKVEQVEKVRDAEQSKEFDYFNRGTGRSSPISLPAPPQRISTGRELFYQ